MTEFSFLKMVDYPFKQHIFLIDVDLITLMI